jgi:acetyl/propionyl-CoA carboxylase alpha subunit/acetyl-CoA carboxylase carboxyltransferase component
VRKLLVANRGEIAVRIIASAALEGLSTVAVYTADDRGCAHVDRADEAFPLPGTGAAGYLDIDAVVAAAVTAGADAIHPGYGFLAENADFARRCAEREVVFAGPPPQALEAFGDKSRARALAARLGIAVPRGTGGPATLDEVRRFLDGLGPGGAVMVKAVAGGGGRGIAPVRSADALAPAYERCAAEARAAFGSAALYAEELIEGARHVEVQVAADAAGTVLALGDRDCSVQRRRQKLIEIAPAPWLDDDVRARLHGAATALIAAVPYRGLATAEFLVRGRDITFLEVNPRIQVEHTVTEEVTGLDLVALALRLADGVSLAGAGLKGAGSSPEPPSRGFAVQARLNAETVTPDGSVLAGTGRLDRFLPPGGRGVRVDTHGYPGYQVSPRYDSLLAKVIASGATLDEALARLRRALGEFDVDGVPVNRDLLLALTADPALREGLVDTGYLDAHLPVLASAALASAALAGAPEAGAPEAGAPEAGAPEADASVAEASVAATLADRHGQGVALRAPMPGVVVQVLAEAGAEVAAGAEVIVFEAMKMHHVVVADRPCVIRAVTVAVGDLVDAGQPVAYAEPSGAAGGEAEGAARADPDHIRDDLRETIGRHRYTLDEGRPQVTMSRHAQGRRTARENIADLVDAGSFVEYGGLTVAAQRSTRTLPDLIERTPGDGVVLGTATAGGVPVAVMSYDYTVLAGTQGRMGHAKTDRFLRVAERGRLPVIVFGEGGGGRGVDTDGPATSGLDCQTFWHISRLVGQVPLIGVVSGFCFAGNAALIGACDVIIATSGSSLGMGGPAMIEGGGLGVYAPEDVGPMDVQTANGVVDILVTDERAAVAAAQAALSLLAGRRVPGPAADQRVQRHLVPGNRLRAYNVRPVIDTLLDEGSGLELRPDYGRGMLTVLGRVDGRPVGVLANNPLHLGGAIDADGADKATRFLRLCDARGLPVVSLCDTPGFMVGPESERQGTVRRFGDMFAAAAALSTPQVTVVLRKAYGLGAMAMAGGYLRASVLTVAWPTGEFGGMGLEGMVRLGHRKELEAIADPAMRERRFAERVAQLYERGKALNAASLFEIDDVLDPAETRSVIAAALSHAVGPGRPRPSA